MSIHSFIESLPAGWATAPIYRAGAERADKKISKGKDPLGRAFREKLSPKFTADFLAKHSESFGACGVFAKRSGILILDIDQNLGTLQRAHPGDFDGPHVLSPKANAGKWLFSIPPELAEDLVDLFHEDTKAGYEVLYARQGVIAGAYAKGGEYRPVGDFSSLPEAPTWILEQMLDAKERRDHPPMLSSREEQYMRRSKEERYAIVKACLSVIPGRGANSENFWWKVGAMIHSANLDDDGLKLFREWSQSDEYFADEWASGSDPCAEKWAYYRNDKTNTAGLGSLITEARKNDPEDTRYKRHGCSSVVEECEAAAVTLQEQIVTFAELYEKADGIFNNLDMSTSERRFELMGLARRCGIRINPVQEVTEMYLGEREKRMGKAVMRTAVDRWDEPAEASYFVPGILCSGVWLVSGRGNSGKTNAAWRFAKHFLSGRPLPTTDGLRSWEKGPVLWLSGDQPDAVMDDQIKTHLTREECENLHIENNFNVNDYPSFLLMAQKYKPKFVVIDSLRSCHRGTGVTENDSEFALPLRWYEQMMGQPGMFEPCMIFVIHHSGKGGSGARGTSALGDMTSFTADFDVPGKDSNFSPLTTRVMTLRKHRFGLKDHQLLATLQDDGTVQLNYIGIPAEKTASSVQDRVRLKMHRSPKQAFTIDDLATSPQVAGSKEAVRKAIQRLIRHGLAVKTAGGKGRTTTYQADGVVAGFSSKGQDAPNKIVSAVPLPSESQSTTGETKCDKPCPTNALSHLDAADKFWDE